MPIRTGIDVTDCSRIQSIAERFGLRFQQRYFPHITQKYSLSVTEKPEVFAGLWAVKEAVFKALGRGFRWKGVEIGYRDSGRPYVQIHPEQARLENTPVPVEAEWDCSITHDSGLAIAFAACYWSTSDDDNQIF